MNISFAAEKTRQGSATRLKPVPPLQLGPSARVASAPEHKSVNKSRQSQRKRSSLLVQKQSLNTERAECDKAFRPIPSYAIKKSEKTALVTSSLRLQQERLEAPVVGLENQEHPDRPFEGNGDKLSFANPPGCWPGSSRKPRSIGQRLGTAPSTERGRVDAATALISEFIKDFGLRSRPEAASWLRLTGLENTVSKVQKLELEVYQPTRLSKPHLDEGLDKWLLMERDMHQLADLVERKQERSTAILGDRVQSIREEIGKLEAELAQEPKEFELAERRTQIIAQQQMGVSGEIKNRRALQNSYEDLLRTNKQLAMGAETTRQNIESCKGWADRRKQEVVAKVQETLDGHRKNVSIMQHYEKQLKLIEEKIRMTRNHISEARTEAERLRNETVLWRSRVEAGVVERSEALTPRPELSTDVMNSIGFQGLEATVERVDSLDSRIATVYSYLKTVQQDASSAKKKTSKLVEKQSFVCPFAMSALSLMGSKLDYLSRISRGPSLALPTPQWSDDEVWNSCYILWQHIQGSQGLLPFTLKMHKIRQACMSPIIANELELEDGQQIHHLELLLNACQRAGQLAGGFEEISAAIDGVSDSQGATSSPIKANNTTMMSPRGPQVSSFNHQGTSHGSPPPVVVNNSSVLAASFIFHEMVHCRAPIRLLDFHAQVLRALTEYLLRADVQNSGRVLRSLADLCARQACNEFNLPALCAVKCASSIRNTLSVRISLGPLDSSGDLYHFSTELMRQLYQEQLMIFKAIRLALLKRAARTTPVDEETTRFSWPYAIETTLLYPLLEDIYYIPASNKMVNRNSPEILQRGEGGNASEGSQTQIYRLTGNQLVKQWTQTCRRVSADRLKERIKAQQSRENSPPEWVGLGSAVSVSEKSSVESSVQKKLKGYLGQIQSAAREDLAGESSGGLSPNAGPIEFNLPKNQRPLVDLRAEETNQALPSSDSPSVSSGAAPSSSGTPAILTPTSRTSKLQDTSLLSKAQANEKRLDATKDMEAGKRSTTLLLAHPKRPNESIPEMKEAHIPRASEAKKWIDSWNTEQIKKHEAQEAAMSRSNNLSSTRAGNRRTTTTVNPGQGSQSPSRGLSLQIPTTDDAPRINSGPEGPLSSPRATGNGGMRIGIPSHWDYLYDVSELLAVLQVLPLRAFLTPLT